MGRDRRQWATCVLGFAYVLGCNDEPYAAGPTTGSSSERGQVSSPPPVTPSQGGAGAVAAAERDASTAGRVAARPADARRSEGGAASEEASARDDAGTTTPSESPAVDTRLTSADWVSYGHDMSNTRHNPAETQISSDTVAQLQLRWSWTGAAVTSTPAYRDGTLYFGDWQGAIVALDARTGTERWRVFDPQKLIGQITTSAFVDDDALYIGGDSAIWYRANRGTGAFDWVRIASDGGSSNTLSSLARIGDLVIAGVASFQNINPVDSLVMAPPFRGSVVALDAKSGAEVWKFVLTTGTGVGVCSSAAFDPKRKRLFLGTGQNYDKTDSKYADSLLVLDYETGEYVWHAQFTKGDSWSLEDMDDGDLDVLSSPVLYTANGTDMVAVGDKGGLFQAFDRDGGFQWSRQLTPGGHHGGIMGSPAYHDGVIYVCSGDFTTDQGDGTAQSGPTASTLFALDAARGDIVWSTPIQGVCYGSITHANGVVYLPGGDGRLHAFYDGDGRELWSVELGESSAGGVAVAHGMLYVSYGWDWLNPTIPGGVKAFGLR